MTLEELARIESSVGKRPIHVVGQTALTIHSRKGHFMYVCAPDGEIEQVRLPDWSRPDDHLGAVCD